MTTQTYSRDYLRALPVEMRKSYLRQYINGLVNQLLAAAKNGQTSVMLAIDKDALKLVKSNMPHSWESTPTGEEIREALLEVFPECRMTYEEKWIQISSTKQEMKKGLTVDWS